MQIKAIETIRIRHDASPRVRTAADELARWIEQFGGSKTPIWTNADAGKVTAWLATDGTNLEPEHFRIAVEDTTTLRVTGGDGRGVLYGVQECVDCARRGQATAPMTDGPVFALRALDMWENISGQIWCLPFNSILDYDEMLHAEEVPEYLDFARLLFSMRVNSLLLSNQYAARGSLFERWLSHAESIEQFAQFMDRYGVAIWLALHLCLSR